MSQDLYISMGVPAGQYFMPDGTVDCQVIYGNDTWGLTPEEYAAWNAVRQTPCAVEDASPLIKSLAQDGAFPL